MRMEGVMLELSKEQAEWLSEKILQAFLESDITEPHGINLARAIVMDLVPTPKPQLLHLRKRAGICPS